MTLGRYLKEARQLCNLTQQQAAAHLNLETPQYIGNIERETCLPSISVYKALIKLYGLNYEVSKKLYFFLKEDELNRKWNNDESR